MTHRQSLTTFFQAEMLFSLAESRNLSRVSVVYLPTLWECEYQIVHTISGPVIICRNATCRYAEA
ncbi:hypothetical protein CC1G_15182 [Coprinopsis cinerea okayama7|uniref:Uncharacterized protein n=1 Tax=Coprinopsis cinerea (strain Okayama-7 / 130 / ATCC MYA-4618 / FGSC 9003) TaxID=240176 RepID=D6RPM9_COPC7|nr:hypothetical protein CC1G_15182 [Coprinopsis cinerea okayama7\|eukprot:XP_002910543.1 hypothetical protein CC1G_15182 [Coprinopsis cinerea okayama7\